MSTWKYFQDRGWWHQLRELFRWSFVVWPVQSEELGWFRSMQDMLPRCQFFIKQKTKQNFNWGSIGRTAFNSSCWLNFSTWRKIFKKYILNSLINNGPLKLIFDQLVCSTCVFIIFHTQSCPDSDHFKDSVFRYVLCKKISMQVQMQVLKKNKFDLTLQVLRLFYFTSWLINSLNFSDTIHFLAERLRYPRWVLSYAIGAIVEVKYKLFGRKTGDFK